MIFIGKGSKTAFSWIRSIRRLSLGSRKRQLGGGPHSIFILCCLEFSMPPTTRTFSFLSGWLGLVVLVVSMGVLPFVFHVGGYGHCRGYSLRDAAAESRAFTEKRSHEGGGWSQNSCVNTESAVSISMRQWRPWHSGKGRLRPCIQSVCCTRC